MAPQQQQQRTETQAEKFFWRKNPEEEQILEATPPSKQAAKQQQQEASPQAQKQQSKSKLVLGVPCHNAEASIGKTVVQLSQLAGEIVVCDDGSSDYTEEVAKKMGCKIVKHPRELGRSDSVTSLFLAAKRLEAEVLLTVGTGTEFSLMDATRLVEVVQKGDVDIAIGSHYSQEAINEAHNEGGIMDPDSLMRAYGKKALTMISPPGTSSVVIEKEVLQFAEQQGLKVREFPLEKAGALADAAMLKLKAVNEHVPFESKVMNYTAVKHPLVFYGIPGLGCFYVSVLETIESSNLLQFSISNLAKFGMTLAASPLTIVSAILAVGTGLLYSEKITRVRAEKKDEKTRL